MPTSSPAISSCAIEPVPPSILGAAAHAGYDFRPLHDDDAVEVGRIRVEALETPGHTPASISIVVYDDREILLLKYTEGWTYKQLAAHLGVKVKTVEHRLMKARRDLRRRLRERGLEVNR